ncbi:MAG: LamG-like jellyroll fold domain-containing protein, partial [Bacteroidota bacterium]
MNVSRADCWNNLVYLDEISSGTGAAMAWTGGDNLDIFHNTVSVGSSNNAAAALSLQHVDTLTVYNNLFTLNQNSYPTAVFNNLVAFTADHNNYWSTTTAGNVAYNGATQTLEEFRNQSGQEQNHFLLDPQFINFLPRQAGLDGQAVPLSAVTTDITGKLRDAISPDLGANEVDILDYDARIAQILQPQVLGLVNEVQGPLEIVVTNFGTQVLSQVVIGWDVNGILGSSPATIALAPGDSTSVLLNDVPWQVATYNNATVWVDSVEGIFDQGNDLDTARVANVRVIPEDPHYGLQFAGANQFAYLGDKPITNATDDAAHYNFTLETWLRADAYQDAFILGTDNSWLALQMTAAGSLWVNSLSTVRFTNFTPQLGRWYHIALVQEVGKGLSLYVDGDFYELITASEQLAAYQLAWYAGGNPATPASGFFKGALDEFRFWEVARTEEQLRQFAIRPLDSIAEGLVHLYPLQERQDGLVLDYASGATGNVAGGAQWVQVATPVRDTLFQARDAGLYRFVLPPTPLAQGEYPVDVVV